MDPKEVAGIAKMAEFIIKDPNFIKDVKLSLDKILKDGKVDMTDVPEIILLVTLGYNRATNFTVPHHQLGPLLTEIMDQLDKKYDIIPKELEESFNKILQTSISLILMNPKVKQCCMSCFGRKN